VAARASDDRPPPGPAPGAPERLHGADAVRLHATLVAGLAICVGRAFAFRRREQRELDMLSRVADRMCRPMRVERIPQSWSSSGRWGGA